MDYAKINKEIKDSMTQCILMYQGLEKTEMDLIHIINFFYEKNSYSKIQIKKFNNLHIHWLSVEDIPSIIDRKEIEDILDTITMVSQLLDIIQNKILTFLFNRRLLIKGFEMWDNSYALFTRYIFSSNECIIRASKAKDIITKLIHKCCSAKNVMVEDVIKRMDIFNVGVETKEKGKIIDVIKDLFNLAKIMYDVVDLMLKLIENMFLLETFCREYFKSADIIKIQHVSSDTIEFTTTIVPFKNHHPSYIYPFHLIYVVLNHVMGKSSEIEFKSNPKNEEILNIITKNGDFKKQLRPNSPLKHLIIEKIMTTIKKENERWSFSGKMNIQQNSTPMVSALTSVRAGPSIDVSPIILSPNNKEPQIPLWTRRSNKKVNNTGPFRAKYSQSFVKQEPFITVIGDVPTKKDTKVETEKEDFSPMQLNDMIEDYIEETIQSGRIYTGFGSKGEEED